MNRELEYVITKNISAFLNTEGGILFIGVDDEGTILGIENDYKTLGKKPNKDGILLKLDSLINNHIGKEFGQFINIKIIDLENKPVCVIEILMSNKPVFLKKGDHEEFNIRGAAGIKRLSFSEYSEYKKLHWTDLI